MKKCVALAILMVLLVAVVLPAWSDRKEGQETEQETEYYISNQDGKHEQILGGKSQHAYRGLERALEHARFMGSRSTDPADPKVSKGDSDTVTEVTKVSKK